jgi:antitoxin component YwqK of YwqJK toxin-antitoxin module
MFTTALATPAVAAGKGFYPDGQIKWEYLFQDGEIEQANWYNEAGQLVSREFYSTGKAERTEGYRADGSLEWQVKNLVDNRQEVTRFDTAGMMTVQYEMADGQPDGKYTTYLADGQPKQTVTYKKGVLDGPARTFFPSGQVEHEFSYVDGQVDGYYRTFSEDGKLLTEYIFSAGQLQ